MESTGKKIANASKRAAIGIIKIGIFGVITGYFALKSKENVTDVVNNINQVKNIAKTAYADYKEEMAKELDE